MGGVDLAIKWPECELCPMCVGRVLCVDAGVPFIPPFLFSHTHHTIQHINPLPPPTLPFFCRAGGAGRVRVAEQQQQLAKGATKKGSASAGRVLGLGLGGTLGRR